MSSPAVQLVIDARPRGQRGPLAAEVVLGRTLLSRLLEQALLVVAPGRTIAVHAREDEHSLLIGLMGDALPRGVVFATGPPQAGAAILRADRLYDARRLRRAIHRGRSPETAVIWRLDRADSLQAAEEELTRRLTYQPLGRFWAFPLAMKLAAALEPTWVRPNGLTLGAGAFMLAAAGMAAFAGSGLLQGVATALALAVALVLDTTDGRLARLQGTGSAFGRWLEQVLDELADLALHTAIAWSMFQSTSQPGWLVLGTLYAAGKYLFVIQSLAGDAMEKERQSAGRTPGRQPTRSRSLLRRLVRLAGHADIRWHLWIVLALIGRLDLALVSYAIYFPLRALGGGLRKAVVYA